MNECLMTDGTHAPAPEGQDLCPPCEHRMHPPKFQVGSHAATFIRTGYYSFQVFPRGVPGQPCPGGQR